MSVLLVDFDLIFDVHDAFLRYIEKDPADWPKGEHDYKKVTGYGLEDASIEFWMDLKPRELGLFLIPVIAMNQTVITGRVISLSEAAAKFSLIHAVVDFTRAFIPVREYKHTVFDKSMILVDELEIETDNWAGPKILVPSPRNHVKGDPMEAITTGIQEHIQ